jgi:hypothetical protein
MFECLASIKVPSGFSSNIKGIINVPEKKFLNLKSHDCHVLMVQLLPVALKGILPPNVRLATVKLCAFLNAISQKVIDLMDLAKLQNDVVQCLVSFELVFPPFFFNIMTHLLVHLVKEISILSPVFLHNMFPFERFMGVLKKYVHNRARPEGSIAKGYGDEDMTPMHMTMFGTWDGGEGGQQGCPSQEGGPRLIRFESPRWRPKATQVRVCLGIQDQSVLNWSPRTHLDSVFDDPHMDGKII